MTSEIDFNRGSRSVWLRLFRECLRHLSYDDPDIMDKHLWITEREDVIEKLREVCSEFGDNEWENDLFIPDVIDKHLVPYLYENES